MPRPLHIDRMSVGNSPFIEPETHAFRRTIVALFAAGFATFALLYCVQPLMPRLSLDFGLDAARASLVLSVSTGALACGLTFTGSVSDAVGRKPVMSVAMLSAALCTFGSAVMPTWGGVLVMRALVGLSLSGLVAVAVTYLSEEIQPRVLGFAIGLYIAGNGVGGMTGRLVAGVLVDFVPWRTAVATMGCLALVATGVFWANVPASRHFVRTRWEPARVVDGFRVHLRDAALPWLFLEAFLLLGAFVTLFNYLSYRLLAAPYGLSQAVVGSTSLLYLSGIYSSPRAGAIADRLGRERVLSAAISLMLVGALVTLARPLLLVILGMLTATAGFFGAHSVASGWVGARAKVARGQASSLYLLSYYLGSSVAGTLGGVCWGRGGWSGVVAFVGGVLAVALGVSVRLWRVARSGDRVGSEAFGEGAARLPP